MARSSFTSVNILFVFCTKNRKNLIDSKFKSHLWAYMGGIAWENKVAGRLLRIQCQSKAGSKCNQLYKQTRRSS